MLTELLNAYRDAVRDRSIPVKGGESLQELDAAELAARAKLEAHVAELSAERDAARLALQQACGECGSDDPQLDANCPYRRMEAKVAELEARLAAIDELREIERAFTPKRKAKP